MRNKLTPKGVFLFGYTHFMYTQREYMLYTYVKKKTLVGISSHNSTGPDIRLVALVAVYPQQIQRGPLVKGLGTP